MRDSARAVVALAAAYAVALQAILLAVGNPVAGAAEFAAVPICSSLGAGHSKPGGHSQDCLGACLTGCCSGNPFCPAPGPALAYPPAPLQAIAVMPEAVSLSHVNATRAHRSRAPPLA